MDSTLLWTAGPYVVTIVFVVGMLWRYKYDRYGWTTRSSQMYESRLLRLGSPLFHFGILMALGGHILGLLIPASLTARIGITEKMYHAVAVTLGTVAGLMVTSGLLILIYRRRTVGRVFQVTTKTDKAMYLVLGSVIGLGVWNTIGINLFNATGAYPGGYDYRESIAVWFRSVAYFSPRSELMVEAPITFQMHTALAMLLFAIIPVTRLVHIFSAPLGYLTRPYLVYRSRDPLEPGSRKPARGWEPIR
jgi:nitrate reductase gamma subunit